MYINVQSIQHNIKDSKEVTQNIKLFTSITFMTEFFKDCLYKYMN